jgi:hypothetical protein
MIDLKENIKNEHIEMVISDFIPEEPIHISIKKNFDTACWSFNEKSNKHSIYIGDKILEKVINTGKKGIEYYVSSYLHHEMSHALHTLRDMNFINTWLNKEKIPFSLFNLFEDARIEYLWRVKADRLFNWANYEELPEISEDSSPTNLMFIYIQKEGKIRSEIEKMQKVKEYYSEILDCKETVELFPILKKWIEEFPETKDDLEQLEKDGYLSSTGDLSTTIKLQSSDSAAEEFDKEAEDVIGKSFYKDENNNVEVVDELTEIEYDYSTKYYDSIFDSSNSYEFDKEKATKLIPFMQKIFKQKSKKICQSNATNKVSTKNFLNSRFDRLYKKKIVETKGKKKINLIIDCSGSMSGGPIQNARTFTYILNEFAKRNYLEGYLILTGADSSIHQCMTMKFPINSNDISHIIADGGAEGLKGTIDKTKQLIKKSDWTFVITDGNITDNSIDTKGLQLFGMYVGNPESCNLSKWFNKYIARESLDELIQVLINKL